MVLKKKRVIKKVDKKNVFTKINEFILGLSIFSKVIITAIVGIFLIDMFHVWVISIVIIIFTFIIKSIRSYPIKETDIVDLILMIIVLITIVMLCQY